MISLTTAAPAVSATFFASLVEVVEAFTIVLAAGTLRGWRAAIAGTTAGLAALALIVVALGLLLDQVPLHLLQLVIGILPAMPFTGECRAANGHDEYGFERPMQFSVGLEGRSVQVL